MSVLVVSGRFIVSTGRCGSTLLSNLLHEHPAVLSLSELFAMLHSTQVAAFPRGDLTGEELWRVVTTPRPEVNQVMQRSGADDSRRARLRLGPMPPLMMGTLPRFTADPRSLHDELGAYVRALPRAPTGTQYSRLFDWLCARLGRRLWVERSGGSTWFVDDLVRCWPEGRFLHLVRDGRDVALSMSENAGFRMAVLVEELGDRVRDPGRGRELLASAIAAAASTPVPLQRFGDLWSRQVLAADHRLSALPATRVMRLRYEDLTREPARELRRLVDFLGIEDAATDRWVRDMAPRVLPARHAWTDLPAPERASLEAACEPGLRHLGYG